MKSPHAIVIAVLACMHAIAAEAQRPAAPRETLVEVNVGFLTTTRTFSDSAAPMINAEAGQISASYQVPRSMAFSVSAYTQVWKQLSAGVTYGQSGSSASADISASLPHPFFFSRSRQIQGTASGAERKESIVGLLVRRAFPVARQRATLAVFGGPAWLSVQQGVVERVNYSETYPYDSATYTSAVVRNVKSTRFAVLVGSDLTYFVSRRIGVGAGFKYSAASTNLPASLDTDVLAIKAGGLDITTGIRFRF
jgi:hypothetical protein